MRGEERRRSSGKKTMLVQVYLIRGLARSSSRELYMDVWIGARGVAGRGQRRLKGGRLGEEVEIWRWRWEQIAFWVGTLAARASTRTRPDLGCLSTYIGGRRERNLLGRAGSCVL